MNKDLKIITDNLTILFKHRVRTRYWLMIDQTYNMCFNSQRSHEQLKSILLHKLTNYDLVNLEKLLISLRQTVKLTSKFVEVYR